MSPFEDIEITCICGEKFIWSYGEQEFMTGLYADGKIASIRTPKRCQSCRIKKAKERESR